MKYAGVPYSEISVESMRPLNGMCAVSKTRRSAAEMAQNLNIAEVFLRVFSEFLRDKCTIF